MAPFAGQAVELCVPPFPRLRLAIAEGGTLAPAAEGAPCALTLTVGPQVLPALVRGEDHFARAVETSGDPALAAEVMRLVRHLRWDAEEDLAKLLGDAAAHRLAQGVRAFFGVQREAARRIAEAMAEYAVEESGTLVRRGELAAHARAVSALRDALERLERRLGRLEA